MTTACIIQARLGSTRLPAKVLLPLPTGRMVIEEVVFRCRQIGGVDIVVVAIPDTAENDIIAASLASGRVRLVRGPEHDVLRRYVIAADAVKADVIMRVTSDCPLIDPAVCEQVLKCRADSGLAYCCNNMPPTYPLGLDCEAFTIGMLRDADRQATRAEDREHVTPFMRRLVAGATSVNVASNANQSGVRWTLDTPEDYVAIWNEFDRRLRTPSVPGHPVEAHAGA